MIETGLAGRVVIVTGGAAGIGRATSLRFAAEGAKVSAWDVKQDATLVAEIEAAGGQGMVQQVDVTNADAVKNAVDEVVAKFGAPWVLVNNAGVLRDGQLVKMKDGELLGTMTD